MWQSQFMDKVNIFCLVLKPTASLLLLLLVYYLFTSINSTITKHIHFHFILPGENTGSPRELGHTNKDIQFSQKKMYIFLQKKQQGHSSQFIWTSAQKHVQF